MAHNCRADQWQSQPLSGAKRTRLLPHRAAANDPFRTYLLIRRMDTISTCPRGIAISDFDEGGHHED
jgi:hypothetical protein